MKRYKNFNGVQGNSATETINGAPASATNVPDKEDANRDQTLSKTESYFQYRISMRPEDLEVVKITSQIFLKRKAMTCLMG